jgi:hypothetical protein
MVSGMMLLTIRFQLQLCRRRIRVFLLVPPKFPGRPTTKKNNDVHQRTGAYCGVGTAGDRVVALLQE